MNKFLYPKGGAERAVLSLGAALESRGHTVAWFGMADERNTVPPARTTVVRHREYRGRGIGRWRDASSMLYSFEARRRFAAVLDEFRPDVVHVHNIYHQLTPSILDAARTRGVPVVMTVHDYKLVCPRYDMLRHGRPCAACVEAGPAPCLRFRCADGSWAGSALLAAEAVLHRVHGSYSDVRLFLTPSRFVEGVLRRGGFEPRRLRYVPNGVAAGPEATARPRPGRVVYAGRLSAEKGVRSLVRAAAGVDGLELVVCGAGPLEAELAALARAAPAGRIALRGHLEAAALRSEIELATCVAVPSEWFENAPYAVLEAMAAGRAVLASRIGGLPELVLDGETGFLLPPADVASWRQCLAAVLAEPARLQALGVRARERAIREFALDQQVTSVESIYREVRR